MFVTQHHVKKCVYFTKYGMLLNEIWDSNHGAPGIKVKRAGGLVVTHDGCLAAVTVCTAQPGHGKRCWHQLAATGRVGTEDT